MKRSLRAALAAGLAVAVPAAGGAALDCGPGAPLAAPVRLEYAVTATRGVLSLAGDGVFVYRRSGEAYTVELSLNAVGVFEMLQRSAGTVRPEGLAPATFMQQSSRRPPRSIGFDWTARRVTFSQTGQSEPTRPQLQDRLSLVMQLAWRHQGEPRAAGFELPVAGLRHVTSYVFEGRGAEAVNVPAGRFETVKFERQKQAGDDDLEVWLAPALCSLPVRLRFTDDKGLLIEQRLRAVRAL
jgi:hypothetical protein